MKIDSMSKCFKVNSVEEREYIETIIGDVVYVRNNPHSYLKVSDGENSNESWKKFTKAYVSKSHPKYNLDKLSGLDKPYIFKVNHTDNLNGVPAKSGDLIYRDGDAFMYLKKEVDGIVEYKKIYKL